MDADILVLEAGKARVEVCPSDGGRLGSVVVGGLELLVTSRNEGPIGWGSYPMVPWAGRIREGRFTFAGRVHRLPVNLPPHAIHGVAFDRPWLVAAAGPREATLTVELDARWPFRGLVEQRILLDADGLEVAMSVHADEAMPVTMGWHPWFRRTVVDGDAPVRLAFDAADMLRRDVDGIPTGVRVVPSAGPWDDAFTGLRANPVLEWPGSLRLELESSCRWWVVYSVPGHAICVEPQSGPPDAVNLGEDLGAAVVGPGSSVRHVMRWRWRRV
jgi:aldose 1-epimerase